jgi:hypothetical protein
MDDNEEARSPDATSAVGAVSAAGALLGASAAGEFEASEFTGLGETPLSLLPPAVMRSVSVTDFLSFPADQVTRGFGAVS